jgi:4a-hydroxytetrahydrobiopterin dehydratase
MDWEEKDHFLVKTFTFSNFVNAFTFMSEVAVLAEKMEHHPWWENAFHRVTIRLTTHAEGHRVTEKDFQMAEKIDLIYEHSRK